MQMTVAFKWIKGGLGEAQRSGPPEGRGRCSAAAGGPPSSARCTRAGAVAEERPQGNGGRIQTIHWEKSLLCINDCLGGKDHISEEQLEKKNIEIITKL
jgi:hypothetical protein